MSRTNRYRTNDITYLSLINSLLRYGQENQRINREIVENNSQMQRFLFQLIQNIPTPRAFNFNANEPSLGVNRMSDDTSRGIFNTEYPDPDTMWRSFNIPSRPRPPNFSVFPPGFFNPVNIAPTSEQISRATSIITYGSLSPAEQEQEEQCPITLTPFSPDSSIMRINSCGHYFMAESLQQHFRTSTRCPICRADIRDSTSSTRSSEPSSTFTQTNIGPLQFTTGDNNANTNRNISGLSTDNLRDEVRTSFIDAITQQLAVTGLTTLNNIDTSNNTLSLSYSLLTPANIAEVFNSGTANNQPNNN